MDIDTISQKIISSPNFLKLKNVIENNPYHDHESVYDHLIKAFEKAKIEIKGEKITNPLAKEKYLEFLNQTVGGIKKEILLQILALIHDIGKMTCFNENGEIKPILEQKSDGTTQALGHEYAGSVITREILKDSGLSSEAIKFLAKGIRLHNSFNGYYKETGLVDAKTFIASMKQRSEGMHVEQTFNAICDNYSAIPFKPALNLITEMLNDPNFYEPREYFIK